jgi:hypothetical protein
VCFAALQLEGCGWHAIKEMQNMFLNFWYHIVIVFQKIHESTDAMATKRSPGGTKHTVV